MAFFANKQNGAGKPSYTFNEAGVDYDKIGLRLADFPRANSAVTNNALELLTDDSVTSGTASGVILLTSTGAVRVPIGLTNQRPVHASDQTQLKGFIRFNTELETFEGHDGDEWSGIGEGGKVSWNVVGVDTTAEKNNGYQVILPIGPSDTNVNITLPSNRLTDDFVVVADYNGTLGVNQFGTATVTVKPSVGDKLHGVTDDEIKVDVSNAVIQFAYIDDTVGWKIVDGIGESQIPDHRFIWETIGDTNTHSAISNVNYQFGIYESAGAVIASSLNSGGTGYSIDDVGKLVTSTTLGDGNFTIRIDSVSAGSITGYSIYNYGSGYTNNTTITFDDSVTVGSGLSVDISEISTTGGDLTITLPTNPSHNDFVGVADYLGTVGYIGNLIVSYDGNNPIQGANEDFTIDVPNIALTFTYLDNYGWKITDGIGESNSTFSLKQYQSYYDSKGNLPVDNQTFNIEYDPGYVDVYVNGLKLIDGDDYTALNGTEVVLSSPLPNPSTDVVEINGYNTAQVINRSTNISKSNIDIFDGIATYYTGLNVKPGDEYGCTVSLGGVIQEPITAYTFDSSGNIIFSEPPESDDLSCFIIKNNALTIDKGTSIDSGDILFDSSASSLISSNIQSALVELSNKIDNASFKIESFQTIPGQLTYELNTIKIQAGHELSARVSLGGVIQEPNVAFYFDDNSIVFSEDPEDVKCFIIVEEFLTQKTLVMPQASEILFNSVGTTLGTSNLETAVVLTSNKVDDIETELNNKVDSDDTDYQNLVDSVYVTEYGTNANGDYRKWSNGFIEQWGSIITDAISDPFVSTYPTAFTNLSTVSHISSIEDTSIIGFISSSSATLTTFNTKVTETDGSTIQSSPVAWRASGF